MNYAVSKLQVQIRKIDGGMANLAFKTSFWLAQLVYLILDNNPFVRAVKACEDLKYSFVAINDCQDKIYHKLDKNTFWIRYSKFTRRRL